MRHKFQLKWLLICITILLVAGTYFVLTSRHSDDTLFYNESLAGIPYYSGQELIQSDMTEDGNNNTEGILSYIIRDTEKTPMQIAEYLKKHTDQKKWTVKLLNSEDQDIQKLQYDATSDLVLSTTYIVITRNKEDLMISLISYYDDSKILEKSKQNKMNQ